MRFSVIASQASAASGARSSRERDERRERHRAAGHVGMHVEHRAMRLQIHAAGVEQDPLADQRHVGPRARAAARRPVAQVRDAGAALGVAGGDREERAARRGAAAHRSSSQRSVRCMLARQPRDRRAVAGGVEDVRRQRGEPAHQVRALRDALIVVARVEVGARRAAPRGARRARSAPRARKLGSAKACARVGGQQSLERRAREGVGAGGDEADALGMRAPRPPSACARPVTAARRRSRRS